MNTDDANARAKELGLTTVNAAPSALALIKEGVSLRTGQHVAVIRHYAESGNWLVQEESGSTDVLPFYGLACRRKS